MAQSLKSQGSITETHLHTSIDTEGHFYPYPELTKFQFLKQNFLVFEATWSLINYECLTRKLYLKDNNIRIKNTLKTGMWADQF